MGRPHGALIVICILEELRLCGGETRPTRVPPPSHGGRDQEAEEHTKCLQLAGPHRLYPAVENGCYKLPGQWASRV